MSKSPIGNKGWASQSTRGHLPKSARLYLSTYNWCQQVYDVPGQRTYHLRQTPSSDDITGVNKAVKMSCGLFDLLAHVIFAIKVEDVGDKIKGILVVLNFRIKACQVEAVGEVFFVDLAEVFVAT